MKKKNKALLEWRRESASLCSFRKEFGFTGYAEAWIQLACRTKKGPLYSAHVQTHNHASRRIQFEQFGDFEKAIGWAEKEIALFTLEWAFASALRMESI